MSEHTVLFARKYDFQTPEGNRMAGVKITYLDHAENTKDTRGLPVLICNAPIDVWGELSIVPGKYDLEFNFKMDSKINKPVVTIASMACVGKSE